jgi:hypothetical protein
MTGDPQMAAPDKASSKWREPTSPARRTSGFRPMATRPRRRRARWWSKMRNKGDEAGADVWLRIIVAIGTLGEPPTNARH